MHCEDLSKLFLEHKEDKEMRFKISDCYFFFFFLYPTQTLGYSYILALFLVDPLVSIRSCCSELHLLKLSSSQWVARSM